jgi:ribosomal protein S12 methylthiotransferase accessory factor
MVNKEVLSSKVGTRLDLETIDDGVCRSLLENINNCGIGVAVWYCTTNIDVPVFTCSIWDNSGSTIYPQRSGGHGCHPYKRIALSRAITEAVQSRLTYISGSRDDVYWKAYREVIPTGLEANIDFIRIVNSEASTVDYRSISEAPGTSVISTLKQWLKMRVSAATGQDIYFVLLSPKDWPVSVAQIIAPRLENSLEHGVYTPGERMCSFLQQKL